MSAIELLDPIEVRVLGALLEKEITTPEYYPLTLNALVNACNQRSNRDPVVNYDDETVEDSLESLRAKRLASTVTGAGIRVPKHRELLSEALNLGRRELALVCVLMLRGYQTPGELRDRVERMYSFSDLEEVETCLQHLIEREPEPLVARLPRRPGEKESRYAHLLSGAPAGEPEPSAAAAAPPGRPSGERLTALEAEVERLQASGR